MEKISKLLEFIIFVNSNITTFLFRKIKKFSKKNIIGFLRQHCLIILKSSKEKEITL